MTDPYRPTSVPVPPSTRLPAGRLRRLAISERVLDALRTWWDGQTEADQARTAARLAILPDSTLADLTKQADELFGQPMGFVQSRVELSDPFDVAALLALAVEQVRPRRRATLAAWLDLRRP